MSQEHITINDTSPRVDHVGDGTTSAFVVPFPFLETANLTVWLNGAPQIEGGDYTVNGAGASDGGTVTFANAPSNGSTVAIMRQLPIARTSDFLAGSALRAAALNTELDRLTMVGQELEDADRRSLRIAAHEAAALPELPAKADRAGRLLSFDDDGQPEAGPLRSDIDQVQQIVNAEADATAAAVSAEASAADAADSAAEVATAFASVDGPGILANHSAATSRTVDDFPVPHYAIGPMAFARDSLIFFPETTQRHIYRTTDSGAWHINASPAEIQWFDLSNLGIGQIFRAAQRIVSSGDGHIVVDPGTDNLGNPNVFRDFESGAKLNLFSGESAEIVATSATSTGGTIFDVVQYNFVPRILETGVAVRFVETAEGFYDGWQDVNLGHTFQGVEIPLDCMLSDDPEISRLAWPDVSAFITSSTAVEQFRINVPDREYTISNSNGTPFEIGEEVTVTSPARTLRCDWLKNDPTKIGLTSVSGGVPASTEVIVGTSSGAQATIDSHQFKGDLEGGITAFVVHNPKNSPASARIRYYNLEKIT